MDSDWRLFREQDKYLRGVTLIRQSYISNNPFNDHDHCEFCMAKFGKGMKAFAKKAPKLNADTIEVAE